MTRSPFILWLKQRRRALDLTQAALAEALNCSLVTVSKIEMGQRRPSVQIAGLLASALGVSESERPAFVRFARGLTDIGPQSVVSSHDGLPAPLTPALGRETELIELAQRLDNPACRLLTLSGAGGVGKTHLALTLAHAQLARFADGAAFVALAGVSNSAEVPSAIALALGLTLHGAGDIASQVVDHVRARHMFVLVDNVEHVLADGFVSKLLLQMLTQAPRLVLLLTSREPLGIAGEWHYRVQGLPVTSAANGAQQLFMQVAQRGDARFAPTLSEQADIARICAAVEGLPLAIELAAAWTTTLSVADIAREITRNPDFLADPSGRASDAIRPRSMRAVFEQSWRLLNDAERQALAALSVFRHGFTRDHAEAIADTGLPVLASLLAKSLVRRGADGRYELHALVRQFAAEQLARDPAYARDIDGRHARCFLMLLAEAEPQLRSAEQTRMLARLLADIDNVRAAWDWAVAHNAVDALNAGMRGLARLCYLKSWNAEAMQRLGTAAALRDDASTAHMLAYHSWFCALSDEIECGLRLFDEVFARMSSHAGPGMLIELRLTHALTLYKAERYDEAALEMGEVLRLSRLINNRWFEGVASHTLAYAAFVRDGETARSFAEVMRAADMLQAEGDVFQAVEMRINGGNIAIAAGRFVAATQLLAACSTIAATLDNPYLSASITLMHGKLAQARGDRTGAIAHFEQSVQLFGAARASAQAAEARALLQSVGVPRAPRKSASNTAR